MRLNTLSTLNTHKNYYINWQPFWHGVYVFATTINRYLKFPYFYIGFLSNTAIKNMSISVHSIFQFY